jgi:hypothetical protein
MSTQTLVREDWNDISKLQFRSHPLWKILDVAIFDKASHKTDYLVYLLFETPEGIRKSDHTISGHYNKINLNHHMDIIKKEEVPQQDGEAIQQVKRPPLGIMPKHEWERQRFVELGEAILRYYVNYLPIPEEWRKEYNMLTNKSSIFEREKL